MPIKNSELILNPDGSIYHLNLQPEQISTTIITVGDPGRVSRISRHFDRIDHQVQKREFITHTGEYKGHRMTVISTGIGPDNIDIVLNELDALVNIDLKTREIKEKHTPLYIVRLGTSGALQPDLQVDSFLASAAGLGLDNLSAYYDFGESDLSLAAKQYFQEQGFPLPQLYSAACSDQLMALFAGEDMQQGITFTSPGFYGPQGRSLRLPTRLTPEFFDRAQSFKYQYRRITNFEMETSAIYALAGKLGHHALSVNALLANRATGTFSENPARTVNRLIELVLERLT